MADRRFFYVPSGGYRCWFNPDYVPLSGSGHTYGIVYARKGLFGMGEPKAYVSGFWFYEEDGTCFELFSGIPLGRIEGKALVSEDYGRLFTYPDPDRSYFQPGITEVSAETFARKIEPHWPHRQKIAPEIRKMLDKRAQEHLAAQKSAARQQEQAKVEAERSHAFADELESFLDSRD